VNFVHVLCRKMTQPNEESLHKAAKRARLEESSVGRPRYKPDNRTFKTKGGITVKRTVVDILNPKEEIEKIVTNLDSKRGCIFESAYEYPGRYARWTMGFYDPPLVFEGWANRFKFTALNARGNVILPSIIEMVKSCKAVDQASLVSSETEIEKSIAGEILPVKEFFTEEERSKQNSLFSVVRALIDLWSVDTDTDPQLGLYGAFGYDLTFQFEDIKRAHKRDPEQRDVVLYIPDSILIQDKQAATCWRLDYDFVVGSDSTEGLERTGSAELFKGKTDVAVRRDHAKGDYAKSVEKAREEFKVGNLFECVLSQTFYEPCDTKPSEILKRLRKRNPSPYMFIINLGEQEYLVGASPEMFVRVEAAKNGLRVETCPISGTIRRGMNALEDAERIKEILVNKKEESELTMCTDVDRNDKSRICKPGSVKVIGRRQIEKYSKLIHTVDHVEGYLRDGFDALDAFLVHTWAVTVTGAPKSWAIQFVENNEKSPRCWYGGAVGLLGFDGGMNTGLTLRTIRLKGGVAEVRAGATLLFDSVPEAEEAETELKASAFREAVLISEESIETDKKEDVSDAMDISFKGKNIILIDHEDSFVHTLGSYFRETGANVTTVRWGISEADLGAMKPSLVVLSPGPGNPRDFKCSETIAMLIKMKLPIFGVCLGLQAMVEHFGGTLSVLSYPMHGKPTKIKRVESSNWGVLESSLPESFVVARYHSLFADASTFPDSELNVTARTMDDLDLIMGIEHKSLPIAAVQFHPESILTLPAHGLQLLKNVLTKLKYDE